MFLLVVVARFLVADGVNASHGDETVSEDVTPKADVLATGVQPADRMVVNVGMRKWQFKLVPQPTHPTRLPTSSDSGPKAPVVVTLLSGLCVTARSAETLAF